MIGKDNNNFYIILSVVLAVLCVIAFCALLRVTVFADDDISDVVDLEDEEIDLIDDDIEKSELPFEDLEIDQSFDDLPESDSELEFTTDDIMKWLEENYDAGTCEVLGLSDKSDVYSGYLPMSQSRRFETYYEDDLVVCVYDVSTFVCYYYVNGGLTPIYNCYGDLVTYNTDLHCEEVYH